MTNWSNTACHQPPATHPLHDLFRVCDWRVSECVCGCVFSTDGNPTSFAFWLRPQFACYTLACLLCLPCLLASAAAAAAESRLSLATSLIFDAHGSQANDRVHPGIAHQADFINLQFYGGIYLKKFPPHSRVKRMWFGTWGQPPASGVWSGRVWRERRGLAIHEVRVGESRP